MKKNSNRNLKGSKALICLFFSLTLIFCLNTSTFAATSKPEPVLTVNTALDMEPAESTADDDLPAGSETDTPEPAWVWHPISVVNEPMNGFNAVRRTYALPPDVNPGVISTDDFEMFGQEYTFAYIVQQPTSDESFMEIQEVVTIEAPTDNLNDILPNLEQEIWYERDGFAGTLVLDIHSITSEVAGTSRHTSTATRQRTYPHLSSPDNALVPRTITDNGKTYSLSTVDWQSGSVAAVDGQPVASNFTANATYTAQVTQTCNTGYTVTAEYIGNVFRTTEGKTLFTAVFYGEPIIEVWLEEPEPVEEVPVEPEEPPELITEPVPENSTNSVVVIALAVIGTLLALAAVGAGGFFLAKYMLGYNVTVYSINGPREIVKAGKIKMDSNSPEPTIVLDKAVGHTPAKTDRYIIQIAQRTIPKLINKTVRVVLHDKEAFHTVPERALGIPVYEFEVNFSDDDEPYDTDDAAGAGPPPGGDAAEI